MVLLKMHNFPIKFKELRVKSFKYKDVSIGIEQWTFESIALAQAHTL